MHTLACFDPGDYAEAMELWRRTPGMGLTAADGEAEIRAFLARNPGLSAVARDGAGRLVGTVLCGTDGRRGFLYHLAVDPAARRGGIGSALAERALGGLRALGIEKCHLMVIAGNELGAAFWAARGWKLREDILLFSKSTGAG